MSYIITAAVYTDREENFLGKAEDVEARIVSQRAGFVEFDIRGEFKRQSELTLFLCRSLIKAGFVSFEISHSY